MVNCTSKEVFAVALENTGAGKGEVIVAVVENFLCEAARKSTDPEGMSQALETEIEAYLEMVKTASLKMPEIKFALAQPTLRPLHQWYTEYHEAL